MCSGPDPWSPYESAVAQILGPAVQRNTLHQHEEFDESAITVENAQHLRLLYQIREVLQRRNTLHHTVHAMADVPRASPATTPPISTQAQQQDPLCSTNAAACSRQCENCGNNQQKLIYLAQLMQNIRIGQSNLNSLVSQHETESGIIKTSPTPSTPTAVAQTATQEKSTVRTSKTTEKLEGSDITMSVKIYIPSPPPGIKCSYIGRLIGPNGITIRELQLETRCHIAVRGKGSIKDNKLFRKMRHKPGFGHLREDTHVLIEAKATTRAECRSLIEKAKKRISDMFTPEFDSLKREQLIHLAMLNGTYRQNGTGSTPKSP
ncbi:KH domain protein [Ancylostoma caninum]|uniref:KH domain protein n=2 Tax=Ancylostoma TaxID=29169 RepID=A0A368GER5_ANCCA|nr:KH domain protein [Ancylostoma caninum]